MSRSKKKRWLLRISGILLALMMVLSNFTGLYPAMKALAVSFVVIDAHAADPSTGTVLGGGYVLHGSDVTLEAYPNEGYVFYAWYDVYAKETYYENPLTINATESKDIKAYFRGQGDHDIYVVSNDGGTVSVDPAKIGYAPGDKVNLSAIPNTDYVFEAFLLREEGQVQYREIGNSFFMPNNDVYVKARFRSTVSHNVTIDPNLQHGTFTLLDGKTSYMEGETVRIGISPEEGYECTEVINVPAEYTVSSNVISFKMPGRDVMITGTFVKKTKFKATVYLTPSDSGTVGCDETDTGFLTVWATPKDGYVFVGYYDYTNMEQGALLGTDTNYSTQLTADAKILAVFKKLITHVAYPEGTGTTTDEYDSETKQFTVTATPNEGYVFQYWAEFPSLEIISSEPKFTFVSGTYETIVAFFKIPVTSKLNEPLYAEHGTISIVNYKTTYLEGDEIEVIITPDPGYVLENAYYGEYDSVHNVLTNAKIISGNKFRMPGHDTWIGAEFVRVYNVNATASLSAGGTVTGGGEYKSGETVTLKAKVNEGYDFINWTENGEEVSTEATYQFTASADCELVANFKKKVVIYKNYYYENFEDWKSYEWTFVDADGDKKNWRREEEIDYDVSGGWSLESIARMSYREYDPDNWAITPAIIAPEDARLSFWMYQYRTFRYKGTDTLGVYVGLSPDPNQMIKLKDFTIDTKADQSCQVDLSAYAGQKIYIGFRHYDSINGITLYLDNVEVSGAGAVLTDENLAIAKKSITLYDTISIDFKVSKSAVANYHDPYLLVMQGADKSKITEYREDGDLLIFTYRVAPQMMGEPVVAIPHALNANGEDVMGTALKYSVAEYCCNMLNNAKYQTDEYAVLRRLLVDILLYGDAAQIYAEYKTNELASAKLTDAQRAMGTDVNAEMNYASVRKKNCATVENPLATIETAALFLEAAVDVQFKFTASDLAGLRVVVTDDEAGTNVLGEYPAKASQIDENGHYYVTFDYLNAAQMRKTVYATVMKGSDKVSNTFRYSIESYAYSMTDREGYENLGLLLDAMMRYGDSAAAFAESIK